MLGHELRNPLAPMANALAVMDVAAPESEHVHLARAMMSRQVKQMTRLVDDLLHVAGRGQGAFADADRIGSGAMGQRRPRTRSWCPN